MDVALTGKYAKTQHVSGMLHNSMEGMMDLSKQERLILANQYLILEKLYPEEAEEFAKHRKAIERGYKLHYGWLAEHFFDEMSEEECREVLDILNMHRALRFSWNALDDKAAIPEERIEFRGFDGNSETKQFGYAQYFVLDLGRFTELKGDQEYPSLNSHIPMMDRYRRMLAAWEALDRKSELGPKEIVQIIEA